eukprot:TRINITY_DN1421_c0_g1_i1.p1 TRINITY_DN1421_c0_g1~~TRINITY_DN1421_c0_g1_i1.p1  ORF type:complete len:553 (-),score=220.30 TRINITY_DN1421_c0_g1_i1:414-2072(-)
MAGKEEEHAVEAEEETPGGAEEAAQEAPATEAPAAEAPATEAPATEAPAAEAPAEAPVTEEDAAGHEHEEHEEEEAGGEEACAEEEEQEEEEWEEEEEEEEEDDGLDELDEANHKIDAYLEEEEREAQRHLKVYEQAAADVDYVDEDAEEPWEDEEAYEEEEEEEDEEEHDETPPANGASGRRWNSQAAPSSSKAPPVTAAAESWPKPHKAAKGRSAQVVEEAEEEEEDLNGQAGLVKELRSQLKKMSEESRMLKLELGQEKFKVKTLSDLRGQMAVAQRHEAMARQGESRAKKELQELKNSLGKKQDFVGKEKAQLLEKIFEMERQVQEAQDREFGMKTQLEEALEERSMSSDRVDEANREKDKFRKDSVELTEKLRVAQSKVLQLEQKRTDDREKIHKLTEMLAARHAENGQDADKSSAEEAIKKLPKVLKASASASSASGPADAAARNGKKLRQQANPRQVATKAASADNDEFPPWWRTALERLRAVFPSAAGSDAAGKRSKATGGAKKRKDGEALALAGPVEESLHQRAVILMLVVFISCLAVLKLNA